jgi:hypothetical protein
MGVMPEGATIVSVPGRVIAVAAAVVLLLVGCGGDDDRPSTAAPQSASAPETGRNVARIAGKSPADVASAALLAVYDDRSHQPRGLVLTPQDDWKQAAIAAQFAASPVGGAIVPTAGDYLPAGPSDLLTRLRPTGFPRAQGVEAVLLGKPGNDVLNALHGADLHLTELSAGTPEELAFKAVPFRGGWAHAYSDVVVVVSSQDRDYALPAAAWSAYSGDTVAFVTHDSVPDATRETLVQRAKVRLQKPTIYVIGPPEVVPQGVVSELSRYGPVKRVAGDTPAATSVALARYKDRKTGFGWGLDAGPGNVSLVNVNSWGNAFGALAFASAGPRAPLLLTDSPSSLPPVVVRYLSRLRNRSPNQGFVFGDRASIGPGELAQFDRALAATGSR